MGSTSCQVSIFYLSRTILRTHQTAAADNHLSGTPAGRGGEGDLPSEWCHSARVCHSHLIITIIIIISNPHQQKRQIATTMASSSNDNNNNNKTVEEGSSSPATLPPPRRQRRAVPAPPPQSQPTNNNARASSPPAPRRVRRAAPAPPTSVSLPSVDARSSSSSDGGSGTNKRIVSNDHSSSARQQQQPQQSTAWNESLCSPENFAAVNSVSKEEYLRSKSKEDIDNKISVDSKEQEDDHHLSVSSLSSQMHQSCKVTDGPSPLSYSYLILSSCSESSLLAKLLECLGEDFARDFLLSVFSHFSAKEVRLARQTCRAFRAIATDPQLRAMRLRAGTLEPRILLAGGFISLPAPTPSLAHGQEEEQQQQQEHQQQQPRLLRQGTATVELFNPLRGTFHALPSLAAERYGCVGAYDPVSRTLYVVGGYARTSYTDTVESLCLATGDCQWTPLPPMLKSRYLPGAVVVQGKLYVVGGRNREPDSSKSRSLSSAEVFDPLTRSWSMLPAMTLRRSGCAVAAANGRIYVFGGFGGDDRPKLADCECFDVSRSIWSSVAPLPGEGLRGCSAVLLEYPEGISISRSHDGCGRSRRYGRTIDSDDEILVAGGGSSTVYRFSVGNNRWIDTNNSNNVNSCGGHRSLSTAEARGYSGLGACGSKAYIIGGCVSGRDVASIETLDAEKGECKTTHALDTTRGAFACVGICL